MLLSSDYQYKISTKMKPRQLPSIVQRTRKRTRTHQTCLGIHLVLQVLGQARCIKDWHLSGPVPARSLSIRDPPVCGSHAHILHKRNTVCASALSLRPGPVALS